MYPWSSAKVAEQAMRVLEGMADDEGYVAATAVAMAPRIDASVATASRALRRLAETGAVRVVSRGVRGQATVYRLVRAVDAAVLRDVPTVV